MTGKKQLLVLGVILLFVALIFVLKSNILHGTTPATQQGSSVTEETQGEPRENSQVEIPPEKQQLIGIKKVEVSVRPFQRVIRTVGRVDYDESRLVTVNSKVEGWIEKLHVNTTGRYW